MIKNPCQKSNTSAIYCFHGLKVLVYFHFWYYYYIRYQLQEHDTKNITEIILHPIRMRIIQEMAVRQGITASDLCTAIPDVPRTTLYRHISVLVESGIVSVVSERKIRGSLERTLALNLGEAGKHNTLENATQNALAFLLNRYTRFHTYFGRQDADPGRDKIFLNSTVMMMDDEEFDRFLQGLRDLLVAYSLSPRDGRKPRDISVISSPVEETSTNQRKKR